MRLSIGRVLIALSAVAFVCNSSFSAPKNLKEGIQTKADQPTSVAPAQKVTLPDQASPTKEPVQPTTDISTGAPVETQVVPSTTDSPIATGAHSAAYSIDWFVIASGGGSGSSTNYAMDATVGQTAVGEGSSTNYSLNSGFWQNFAPAGCCVGIRGDCNNDGGINPNILDLNFAVNRIFRGGPLPVCAEEGNVNGDAFPFNIIDLNFLVNRIFRGGPLPPSCPASV